MAGRTIRVVNVVPLIKVKKELPDEDEDDYVLCQVCDKSFANETALRNHARMEHTDVFATGDASKWMKPIVPKTEPPSKEYIDVMIKKKTKEFISSMAPTNLKSLASEDVSYIIIKGEMPKEKERKRKSEIERATVAKREKEKEKEVQPITGPFECLQPSTLVADGTCHQIFFSCCEYSAHFRDEHTRRRKGLRCQVCEKPLVADGESIQAPYPCEVCGAGFQTNKELSEHMAIDHIKLKPFECGVCHKRFTQQGGVQQHMRMHTGDRPFPCTYCPKAFTQKSGLDQHLRIHTKVKPYRCVICSKTFCQSVHLKQHMRTHTNVSPFQCGICQKRFKQSSHLNYHLKNHNTASMTDAQKNEYKKLITMIKEEDSLNKKEDRKYVYMMDKYNGQLVEVEIDGNNVAQEVQESTVEEVPIEDSEIIQEQILAEQSIQEHQVDDGEDTYILGDVDGAEGWGVKVVAGGEIQEGETEEGEIEEGEMQEAEIEEGEMQEAEIEEGEMQEAEMEELEEGEMVEEDNDE